MKQLLELNLSPYPTIPCKEYAKTMKRVVEPFLRQKGKPAFLRRSISPDLYCELYYLGSESKGTILISHGFTESCLKYEEVIYYFLQNGYSVVMPEYRGFGHSRTEKEHDIANTPTHVRSFADYLKDLNDTVTHVLVPNFPKPYFLFGHSMGGAIAAAYLEQHPNVFQKAILSSPMLEISRGNFSKSMAKALTSAFCCTGQAKRFLPGQHPFSSDWDFEHSSASCEERYRYYLNQQKSRPLLQNAGSSNGWARTCLFACDELLRPKNCAKVQAKVLLFQAEWDSLVLPKAQQTFIDRIPDGELIVVPRTKHEIYRAKDDILPYYWSAIFTFLSDK